jgi:hypothetical protein
VRALAVLATLCWLALPTATVAQANPRLEISLSRPALPAAGGSAVPADSAGSAGDPPANSVPDSPRGAAASPAALPGSVTNVSPVADPHSPTQSPAVRGIDMLADGQTRDLLRSGFPARLHFRLELWTAGGIFNHLEATREWDVVVRYDPLAKRFRAARIVDNSVTVLGDFGTYADLATVLSAPYPVALAPARRGRYYYSADLDVEMLSLGDLDEVERWLRGELRPAVRGQRNAGTAVTRGLRTLFLKLIGGERRHYEARSKTFRV